MVCWVKGAKGHPDRDIRTSVEEKGAPKKLPPRKPQYGSLSPVG